MRDSIWRLVAFCRFSIVGPRALDKSAHSDADAQISNAAAVAAVQPAQGALDANEVTNAAAFVPFLRAQAAALRATAPTSGYRKCLLQNPTYDRGSILGGAEQVLALRSIDSGNCS